LAEKPFEFFNVAKRKVDVNGLVEVEARYYGVPPRYVGEMVVAHFNREWVKFYSDGDLIITHRRLSQRGRVVQPASCLPPWKHPNLESQERYYCHKAREIGPNLHHLVYRTLCSDSPLSIRRVRGFLSLARTFGGNVVENAALKTLSIGSCSYHTAKSFCEQLKDAPSEPQHRLAQTHELIRPLSEYDAIINHERNR